MTLEGEISADSFKRIAEVATITASGVRVSLKFFSDEDRFRVIAGTIATEVDLDCQRCLTPVGVKVESQFEVAIVASDESAKDLPSYYEPVIVEEDNLDLVPLIEEELLLALPMYAYHDQCDVKMSYGDAEDTAEVEEPTPNPFQVLANLKVGKTKN
ncbi:DUF177 domain-containing protein [Litoribacillus peritrichatus]|uniref:Large ribosomal RNA subunit accumulation protein YceD n=2 Tax=Litoribacillus peritrichatus TaxID=718191 RepID=A0ABP7N3U1_9GAMM